MSKSNIIYFKGRKFDLDNKLEIFDHREADFDSNSYYKKDNITYYILKDNDIIKDGDFICKDGRVSQITNKRWLNETVAQSKLNKKNNWGIYVDLDRKSTRLNSSHSGESRMPSSA